MQVGQCGGQGDDPFAEQPNRGQGGSGLSEVQKIKQQNQNPKPETNLKPQIPNRILQFSFWDSIGILRLNSATSKITDVFFALKRSIVHTRHR